MMEDLAKILILSGMATSFIAQVIGTILVFRTSPLQGILIFIIPGYLFFALRRNGYYWKVVGLWLAGVVLLILGMSFV